LRVAFLSHDFRQHAGGTLVIGLLENLPRTGIEWWAYCNSIEDRSSIRNRARGAFERFINVARLDDAELAEKIHDDEIDVVIDLNGMTGGSRIGALAYQPAPVQIVWKGMPGSVGTRAGVDYIIGDPWVITETNRNGFSESVIRLPRSYQPNDHEAPDLDLAGERADHDLPAEGFVFCNFNQLYKLSPDTFARWCEILQQTEGSVLWLLRPKSTALEDRLKALAERSGVDPGRIVFAPPMPHGRHVARIRHADLVLDTWPYNAHTTCSDALRAGVPVLTIPGHTFAARVAAGVLDTCGLRDWIAADETAFVDKALAFAARPRAEIDRAKQTVFETYWGSEMVDNAKLGAYFETLCTEVVEQARTGRVADFDIAADRSIRRSPFGTPETVATDGEIAGPTGAATAPDADSVIDADASEHAGE
jgi:predicted O-linked N-acetylglucosamine transferase (SPINDLY family)